MEYSLDNLAPVKGSRKEKVRLGRGPGSGLGKTSGKGHKGQKARTGGKVARHFEGGQMPLYRRIPKLGFKSRAQKTGEKKKWKIVDVSLLERFEAGAEVGLLELYGLIGVSKSKCATGIGDCSYNVKVLGNACLTKAIKLSAHAISAQALSSVENAGGSFNAIVPIVGVSEAK
jgi:large subunit ribosomal protein L15